VLKLKPLVLEFFGAPMMAALNAPNKPIKNKNKVDPKVAKVGDVVEYWGIPQELTLRATGVIKRMDSRGVEIGDLKPNGTQKMRRGMAGREVNPTTQYIMYGPNKMLNGWKLKDSI
jgi:hypothetical protein